MHWFEVVMWAWCRFVGNALTAIGLAGLLLFALVGLMSYADMIWREEK